MATFAFYIMEFPAGGTGTAVSHTANELIAAGHQVIIYTARHCTDQYPKGYERLFQVVIVPTMDPDTDENLDFLCQHIRENHVAALVVVAMHFYRIKVIKQNTSCKIVYALHGCPFYEAKDYSLNWKHWYDRWLYNGMKETLPIYRNTIDAADRYVVLCEDYAKMLVRNMRLSKANAQKLRVVPNGIETTAVPSLNKEKIIIFVGRLSLADKRPMRMAEIWRLIYQRLPDWRFVIVGDGPEKENLEQYICQHHIERMVFAGFTNDTVSFYQKASIICLTSQYEGWPLCLAEGQAYGVVPIAFDCTAGIRDIISPSKENGVLVPSYNCKAFADKLYRMATDAKWLARMRENVVKKAKSYTMSRNSEGYRKVLEELISD